jgi:predicted dinucleotide-binding enzyme
MKVAIMGAGFVGASLGTALVNAGHEIMFSSRDPASDKMQALISETGSSAHVGTVQETLAYSDVIAFALSWDAALDVAASAGDWSGKIILDMTQGDSLKLAEITGARVVKIFNTIGAEHYQNPDFSGLPATMYYCGDDADAKQTAAQLASDLGFDLFDAGDLSMNKHVVNLAMFWITLMRNGFGRDFAFKIIRK